MYRVALDHILHGCLGIKVRYFSTFSHLFLLHMSYQTDESMWVGPHKHWSHEPYILYSGKLLREKTFVNFTVLWLFAKFFSAKFGDVVFFGAAQASNPQKVFSTKIIFFTNSRKFSPSKVSTMWYGGESLETKPNKSHEDRTVYKTASKYKWLYLTAIYNW